MQQLNWKRKRRMQSVRCPLCISSRDILQCRMLCLRTCCSTSFMHVCKLHGIWCCKLGASLSVPSSIAPAEASCASESAPVWHICCSRKAAAHDTGQAAGMHACRPQPGPCGWAGCSPHGACMQWHELRTMAASSGACATRGRACVRAPWRAGRPMRSTGAYGLAGMRTLTPTSVGRSSIGPLQGELSLVGLLAGSARLAELSGILWASDQRVCHGQNMHLLIYMRSCTRFVRHWQRARERRSRHKAGCALMQRLHLRCLRQVCAAWRLDTLRTQHAQYALELAQASFLPCSTALEPRMQCQHEHCVVAWSAKASSPRMQTILHMHALSSRVVAQNTFHRHFRAAAI